MASIQRLTKRVKDLEEWTKENEMTGGPQGILETFTWLINETRMAQQLRMQTDQNFNGMRSATFEFIEQHKLNDEWNEFLKEKDKTNAVQEQPTEEVPLQEEAESGKEVVETPEESKKDKKE
jgi:hypothetical protein